MNHLFLSTERCPFREGKNTSATQYPETLGEVNFVHFSPKYVLLKPFSPSGPELGVRAFLGLFIGLPCFIFIYLLLGNRTFFFLKYMCSLFLL